MEDFAEHARPSWPSWRWLPAHALAIVFSLGHVILDWDYSLFGPPASALTGIQVLVLMLDVAIYSLWASALVVASRGSRLGMAATMVVCAVGGLGNGLSIVACPPPCSGAPPFGDIAHIGSLIFGAWAVFESALALLALRRARAARTASATQRRDGGNQREEFSR